ncbi:hypothetical protein HYT05_04170 [Candidatus Kaiserbacteria bacterium]|nr:hypothetical protein [Candidatus Kaiserbacteria bacterium]
MIILGSYRVPVQYRGAATIASLLEHIRNGEDPPDFIDHRLSDKSFPQEGEALEEIGIDIVSMGRVIGRDEDMPRLFAEAGYQPTNPAELLSFRAAYPQAQRWGCCITGLAQVWEDHRGYRFVPCLNAGAGHGIRLRMIDAGWGDFWHFAVKKAENA